MNPHMMSNKRQKDSSTPRCKLSSMSLININIFFSLIKTYHVWSTLNNYSCILFCKVYSEVHLWPSVLKQSHCKTNVINSGGDQSKLSDSSGFLFKHDIKEKVWLIDIQLFNSHLLLESIFEVVATLLRCYLLWPHKAVATIMSEVE